MSYSDKTDKIKSFHPDPEALNCLKDNKLHGFSDPERVKNGSNFFLGEALFRALEEFSKEKKMFLTLPKAYIDYKPPKLHKGNTSWYISYYVKDPRTGRFRLYRTKINHIRPLRERLAAARVIMADLQEKLALGWNPALADSSPRSAESAFAALEAFEAVKTKEMEKQSLATYRSYLRVFRRWLESQGFTASTLACCLDKEKARAYMDHLESRPDIAARTYNGYLSFMSVLFGWLAEKGYVTTNWFADFKRKPKRLTKKKRRLLTGDELSRLFGCLASENPEYLCICLLCYCCFMRPKEIALLKCGDIDLAAQTVHVRSEIAKNDNESYRTIPDSALPAFRKLNLSKGDWFVFGAHNHHAYDFTPAAKAMDKKKISDYWTRSVRKECRFGDDVQFYSLKDTGITNMLVDGMAINLVQQQADHSSVAMTAIYVGRTATASEKIRKTGILKMK